VTGIPTSWLVKIRSGQYNKFSNPTDLMSHGKPTARTISPPTRGPVIYFHLVLLYSFIHSFIHSLNTFQRQAIHDSKSHIKNPLSKIKTSNTGIRIPEVTNYQVICF
jgi:hypothetical protein